MKNPSDSSTLSFQYKAFKTLIEEALIVYFLLAEISHDYDFTRLAAIDGWNLSDLMVDYKHKFFISPIIPVLCWSFTGLILAFIF